MSMYQPDQIRDMRQSAGKALRANSNIEEAWLGLHMKADCLAGFAGLASEKRNDAVEAFIQSFSKISSGKRAFAVQAVSDIQAMIEPGLVALQTIADRGQDTTAPALALWREFHNARQSLLDVMQPS